MSGAEPVGRPLDSRQAKGVTAYVFLGTQCPATKAYLERLRALERAYGPKGVTFVFVYPNRTDPSEEKIGFHRSAKLAGPLVDDQGARLARAFAAQKTSEVVLVAKDRTIVYRGGIDDAREPAAVKARHLETALDEHLAGRAVTAPTSQVNA